MLLYLKFDVFWWFEQCQPLAYPRSITGLFSFEQHWMPFQWYIRYFATEMSNIDRAGMHGVRTNKCIFCQRWHPLIMVTNLSMVTSRESQPTYGSVVLNLHRRMHLWCEHRRGNIKYVFSVNSLTTQPNRFNWHSCVYHNRYTPLISTMCFL